MSKNSNTPHNFRLIALSIICAVASCTPHVSAQVTFRVVSYVNQLQQPIGITEGSSGVFYSDGGLPNQSVFSVTTQGAKTSSRAFRAATISWHPS